ncbi:NAD(P)/FAD-dependent oxidoreductase [Sulfitobacter mediterraneus]|uniref:NAD(P)/FAD-dependent oxidoreductase n=1 Tax=Sulfitobacter mediterraneus TaxID=83219 RepID=UPI0019334B5C|nr:NAD(P)/FAD-dependent oxidoreductase [Sulfitobacter mediterraneus]MBM1632489.1 NAD(P)/FAD-dependent oxidoreductase [Sulfitobacter mediterraneus]MBM1640306.1 NAD(P)/FAD-dependent oxidoreductase [Sulfitobacter mediterraneus]MBM1644354.1 NAD(P)/FAD-dependent oxidoreductase [Sulfitobacter mediterraneus]MBM1648401.1 NAD(P)/FAD-dependent oxidoreductase [Sulfitobacter mediterraneus]MBM1652446.1 NAD(P)/FAD-dependent oxidoreductase [Sulfitobacter mediterraneus]
MQVDTAIIGAGAAGMMCAAHAGGKVLLVDHAKAPGEKIRISGGGRCNFTNMYCDPGSFLSGNPHFVKSALARYTQWDFVELVDQHSIKWHEKTLGQLFCDTSAKEIIAMLRRLMQKAGVDLRLQSSVSNIRKTESGFALTLHGPQGDTLVAANNLVIATGGKSIPKMGATGFAYEVAAAFGLPVTETRAGLVPFTFTDARFAPISGTAVPARVAAGGTSFDEALLFTHRGLSGPAVLQASSYWQDGAEITVNLDPKTALFEALRDQRQSYGRRNFTTELSAHLPARLVEHLGALHDLTGNLADWSDARLMALCDGLQNWQMVPSGTEGYRTAEVTLGGVDTDALSSKSMMAKTVPGLYFIGEAVDVTGWLGGYNFQWAWSSAMAAARTMS